jgi:dual specificity MAP kinase phosphatase
MSSAGALAEHPSRSKRANSSNLVFERSKFRATLEDSHNTDSIITERHYSASSVTEPAALGNSLVSPLAPTMAHCWRENKPMSPQWPVLKISQEQLISIMDWHYRHQLPECEHVFPWLHGVHSANHTQREFLNTLKDFTTVQRNQFDSLTHQRIPVNCRGFMPVRSCFIDGEVYERSGVLKGSVDTHEILCTLDVSKQDLLLLLDALLKDLKMHDEDTLTTLFEDCERMRLLPLFRNLDPQRGISLRNFHIQVSKTAQISDFVVYCFNGHLGKDCCCKSVARLLYFAQLKHSIEHPELVDPMYQTMILEKSELAFFREKEHQKFLAMDIIPTSDSLREKGNCLAKGDLALFQNWEGDYLLREKIEIAKMSSATSIYETIWLGNSMDFECHKQKGYSPAKTKESILPLYIDPDKSTVILKSEDFAEHGEEVLVNTPKADWTLYVNCTDGAAFPPLSTVEYLIEEKEDTTSDLHLRFPPSGSLSIGDCNDNDLRTIINLCKLLYVRSLQGKPSLIYCMDGYTESSLLAVCFMIYATGKPLHEVIVELHKERGRPFFLFATDVQLLSRIESILQHFTPANLRYFDPSTPEEVDSDFLYKQLFDTKDLTWFTQVSGSLPSRILEHLYLGSLTHANSFDLLKEFDVSYIVAVGESLAWLDQEPDIKREVINQNILVLSGFKYAPVKKLMCVSNVQDDGIDMLTHNLSDILDFIDECHTAGCKVLVHCRVGVSRSATVCIAEVMRRLDINLIKAYIYVRVRRLNIIIQPNLRFMYELVKWEESVRLSKRSGKILASSFNSNKLESVELSKRLSASMSSISSSFTDLSTYSPVRHMRAEISHDVAITDDEDHEEPLDQSYAESNSDVKQDTWLRDVDWHILCREIDTLNKAYIRM